MATMKTEEERKTDGDRLNGDNHISRTDYCRKLQEWMWHYYCGYANWQSWMFMSALPFPPCYPPPQGSQASNTAHYPFVPTSSDIARWYNHLTNPTQTNNTSGSQSGSPLSTTPAATSTAQPNGNAAPQAGREYNIPSPLHRFLAEMVDFFILFCVKATIVLWIMHLSGMKDISKIVMQFVVEEIDENTSLEDLQKMMAVALVYRVLVCFYEIICIWGAGGATPGKFLLGLRVVTCDSIVLVRPNRVLVVPASNVTLSASTVRALNKNLSIAFLFPVFITLLFFQHNRTVYDIVAGTIVVRRRGAR
ncbi:protein FAM8A1 isoform X1 [Electrophorus electricus]|uniref:RDD domain-containing protein n=1 Tax=Electrophorus electricus TaxID=8005 RepID=A0A4W4G262_ELEEL|nr:protein FAM8A1 isoform X1 [Electrophorus electricus]